ncbi:hypothetical protein BJ508DRAFT_415964 [Ascobolus immersus RN42]|uniref:MARVEL domain-containing protein n=1 Tax=Ascobolus immersus RN42 TaxID=1160509 RepID=A0A3N4I1Q8_ASCIM|nr:hypothetical protein BJ508DRAFT_415964 [Ascobolus immersus RN42]
MARDTYDDRYDDRRDDRGNRDDNPQDGRKQSPNGQAWQAFRVIQIITLIVCWGILAYFVDTYNKADLKVPDGIIAIFVVAILATTWTISSLIHYARTQWMPVWIPIVDILFMIGLIVGVAILGDVASADCIAWSSEWRQTSWYTETRWSSTNPDPNAVKIIPRQTTSTTTSGFTQNSGREDPAMIPENTDTSDYSQPCNLLKTSWGLAIANIIFFLITACLGFAIWNDCRKRQKRRTVIKEEIIERGGPPAAGGAYGYDESYDERHVRQEKVFERPSPPPSVYLAGGGPDASVYNDPSASEVGYARTERRGSRSAYDSEYERTRRERRHSRQGSRSRRSSSRVHTDVSRRSTSRRRSSSRRRDGPRDSVSYVRGV